MQERGQGNFLEKSVREKMKGITFILMQSNSLSGESRDCCFAAQMFHSGQRSRKYHKLRYPQNIRFIKASENWRKMTDLLAGKNFFKKEKKPNKNCTEIFSVHLCGVLAWQGIISPLNWQYLASTSLCWGVPSFFQTNTQETIHNCYYYYWSCVLVLQ